jgi:phosphate starvation-inducible protein PhoH and related proteins
MKKPKKPVRNPDFKLPEALTANQGLLIKAIISKEMVVTTGPAGTGKTYLPAAYAAFMYHTGVVKKIILSRPTVPVGRTIGLFPGDLMEKMLPWTAPFISVLEEYLGKGQVDCMLKNGKLEVVPFEVIRGRTFDDSFVILDEAQNTTIEEIQAFLTRIGTDSKTVINGDIRQSDLKEVTKNGLSYMTNLLKGNKNEELASQVSHIEFNSEDVVRSGLCKLWVQAFEKE